MPSRPLRQSTAKRLSLWRVSCWAPASAAASSARRIARSSASLLQPLQPGACECSARTPGGENEHVPDADPARIRPRRAIDPSLPWAFRPGNLSSCLWMVSGGIGGVRASINPSACDGFNETWQKDEIFLSRLVRKYYSGGLYLSDIRQFWHKRPIGRLSNTYLILQVLKFSS